MNKYFLADYKKIIFLLSCSLMTVLLFISCKKKSSAENHNIENQSVESQNAPTENEDGEKKIYSPSEDDASWVDSLLVQIEEERIADQLATMEESRSEYELEENDFLEDDKINPEKTEIEEKNPIEKFFEEKSDGKIISGKDNQLRFFEFQDEILSPQSNDEGFIIAHSARENVMRNFYNQSYQLVKKEEWRIRSAGDASKLRTELFTYSEKNGKVNQKKIITNDNTEDISYNEAAYPVASKKYINDKDKQYIIMERSWKYDEENRVLSDEEKKYTYKDSDYKNKAAVFVRKYEYKYNDELNNKNTESGDKKKDEIPADVNYYENGILKMQNKYSAVKGNYISFVYFDENLSVKTYYEDDVRCKEEYFNKGQLIRTKIFDKKEKIEEGQESKTIIHQGEKE